jgi:type VI secretion system protein ImpH
VATADRQTAARVGFFGSLARAPWSYDFYQVLRRIECLFAERPRLGRALRPVQEAVRVSQEPSVAFAPSTVSDFEESRRGGPSRLEQRFFGLLGPNGPLPLHFTEYARERLRHHDDPAFARFLDLFHHRMALLFYRAWADAQPTVQHDRPREDRFATYVGTLAGLAAPGVRERDAVPDAAKLFFIGHLAPTVKNAEGLAAILTGYFGLPVRVDQFVLTWLELPADQQTALGGASRPSARLGEGTVLGRRVRDVQSTFRIVMGPMDLDRYRDFLSEGKSLRRLVDWVRNYVGLEFDWQLQVVLARDEVPLLRLGREGRLGRTAWLGRRLQPTDADDLVLTPGRRAESAAPAASAGPVMAVSTAASIVAAVLTAASVAAAFATGA